jgi:hypothetical protein
MDDPKSKVIVAVIAFLGSLIWPALLFWFLYYFRSAITTMLENVTSLKFPGAEIILARVERLRTELQKTNFVVGGLTESSPRPEVVEAAKTLLRPPGELVEEWAEKHGVNPWDMGPKNWERCVFDLGYGGRKNELVWENGKLKYQ